MCNKIKFTKAFPRVDLIPVWRREQSRGNRPPTSDSTLEHFWLLVGFANGPVRSTRMERGYCASDNTIRGATDGPQVNAILHVVFLQLGQNVLAVGVLAKGRDVGPDLGRKHSCRYPGLGRACPCTCAHTHTPEGRPFHWLSQGPCLPEPQQPIRWEAAPTPGTNTGWQGTGSWGARAAPVTAPEKSVPRPLTPCRPRQVPLPMPATRLSRVLVISGFHES